jgi:thiamine biosynthesis lipoprotein
VAPTAGDTVRLTTTAMACDFSVILNPGQRSHVMLASDALSLVHELEAQLSVYRSDSELSRLNARAASEPVAVEPLLFALLCASLDLAERTGGCFDPTTGPLIALWRDCRREQRVPTQAEIDAVRERCGAKLVRTDASAKTIAFERPGMELNLGGIGKGYALDRAAAVLEENGLSEFLLHGGYSSVLARGDHHGLGGWPVGIMNPLFPQERFATILLQNADLSTSGSSIQYFRHQGRRYGHILDPRTGWPAPEALSVTVVAPTAAEADALSTAFFVMGVEKAREYCDNVGRGIGAILFRPPERGRRLEPRVCGISADVLFFHDEAPG